MTLPKSPGAHAVLNAAAAFREAAFEEALRFVANEGANREHIDKIKELRETAEALEWAAAGSGKASYDIDAVIGGESK